MSGINKRFKQFLNSRVNRKGPSVKTENVLIVGLAGGEMVHASQLQLASEIDAFSALPSNRFQMTYVPITVIPQELARNTACDLARKQLPNPSDTLLMIDHDMIQHGWRTLRILDTPDYDIAGALQYMWLPADYNEQRPPEARPCAFMRKADGPGQTCIYPEPGESSRPIDRVGSGFMAIKRRVLDDPRMLLSDDPALDPPALWRNVYRPNYVRDKGLDMDFCDRARDLGYRIVVNWASEIGHRKSVNVNEIDMYAKMQFAQGYALGERHALQMDQERGGAERGANGGLGPGLSSNGTLGVPGLDRESADEEGRLGREGVGV